MFEPGDPRYGEILDLANLATRDKLLDGQRARWRELVSELLGSVHSKGSAAERRQDLRGPAELEVDILAPDEMASLATSTVSAGGISMRIAEVIPIGTPIESLDQGEEAGRSPCWSRRRWSGAGPESWAPPSSTSSRTTASCWRAWRSRRCWKVDSRRAIFRPPPREAP